MAPTATITDVDLGDVDLEYIIPSPDNPRRDLGDLDGLAKSIRAVGVLMPVLLTKRPDGKYDLLDGARRHAASKKAGRKTIPARERTTDLTDAQRLEIMVIANLQREGLTVTEEAAAFAKLVELGWTQRKIADEVGCNQSNVSKRLALLKLPDAARAAVDAEMLAIELAVELTKLDDATVTKLVKRGGTITSYDVEVAVRAAARKRKLDKAYAPHEKKGLRRVDDIYWHGKWEECTERLATAVHISPHSDKVTFLCEKPEEPKTATRGTAKPKKETAKEKREREQRENRVASRRTAVGALVHDPDADLWPVLAAMVLDAGDVDEVDIAGTLGIPVPDGLDDDDYTVVNQTVEELHARLEAYAAVDSDHARRLATAFIADGDFWLGRPGTGLMTGLLVEHGYDAANDVAMEEAAKARVQWADARERGYLPPVVCRICSTAQLPVDGPNVCNACLPDVGTCHDPDAPHTTRAVVDAQLAKDREFVDAHQLKVGDEVHDDGSITRATDDEISAAAPSTSEDNAAENSNGTRRRKRTPRATATAVS